MGGLLSKTEQNCEEKRNKCLKLEEKELIKTAESKFENGNKSPPTADSEVENHRNYRSNSLLNDTDRTALTVEPSMYEYSFENLVFEGGGSKGIAYCGAVKYLEEMKIMPNIKRIAGSSIGAIVAAFLALGYSSQEIQSFFTDDIQDILIDHKCGYLSLLPNLIRGYGWNPGTKILNWFGEKIRAKTVSNNPCLTFFQLYKEKNMELCIVVTNVNQLRAEYCHPKTTPDMPIREALRMSMSLPGIFMSWEYDNWGQKDTYIDGGILCNFPIHCFDGWYLSMEREHSFLFYLKNLEDLPETFAIGNSFGVRNEKTIGFMVYDDCEAEVMRFSLEQRLGATDPEMPEKKTKLYKRKEKEKAIQYQFKREHGRVIKAAESFMKVLHKHNLHDSVVISKDELTNAFADVATFSEEEKEILFGKNVSVDDAFKILDKDCNGQIAFREMLQFLEVKGIRIQTRIQGYGRVEINGFIEYISAILNAWTANLKNVYLNKDDVNRTVGIDTGHVGTNDYDLEEEDKLFLKERGYNATKAFLKYYIASNPDRIIYRTFHVDETEVVHEEDTGMTTKLIGKVK